jgi:acetyl esterase/lipase
MPGTQVDAHSRDGWTTTTFSNTFEILIKCKLFRYNWRLGFLLRVVSVYPKQGITMKLVKNPVRTLLAASATVLSIGSAFAAGNPNVDHQVQALLQKMEAAGGKPIETLPPVEARKVLAGAQAGVKLTLPKADVSEKTIKAGGGDIKLTIVRPAGATGVLPAFMFFHGGGWVLGDFPTHERFVRDLVVASGAVAVFVNYTPSPEAKYPVAINQAYAATKWVAENGKEIKVDGSRLAVAGNSVGGNMATVVALMAKEKGGPKLRAEILFWPVTDANFETASYNQFAEGHFLTKNMMKWFWDNYTTDAAKRKEIMASPAQATVEQLKGLPPTFIQTAENDVLRDEGEAYGRKLDAAGVEVTSVRYNGMIHDFGLLNGISTVPAVRSALEQAGYELKKHLK